MAKNETYVDGHDYYIRKLCGKLCVSKTLKDTSHITGENTKNGKLHAGGHLYVISYVNMSENRH